MIRIITHEELVERGYTDVVGNCPDTRLDVEMSGVMGRYHPNSLIVLASGENYRLYIPQSDFNREVRKHRSTAPKGRGGRR